MIAGFGARLGYIACRLISFNFNALFNFELKQFYVVFSSPTI
jgi:hypothetical protein